MKNNNVDVLIIGSGAAGLNAALQLAYRGITDILILTEGLERSTSINTGSDKQTYYKLSLCGEVKDAPVDMAESYQQSGSMHGDLALVEAAVSAQAFSHLVELGVPFPHDRYGQFVGYKTDHDPRQRATSIGPYTSKVMCEKMIERIRQFQIPLRENCLAVELLTHTEGTQPAVYGAIFYNEKNEFEAIFARDIIIATGGPGELYRDSVYPAIHHGGIGMALMAGAQARSLPESQFGLASIGFRWNVSGTYLQVIPRIFSTGDNGGGVEKEFLQDYFNITADLYSLEFLKGYQWPFDAKKVQKGSSVIDLLVYQETAVFGRRVFLDFRNNPADLDFDRLRPEASEYLEKSGVLGGTPIERLNRMNPGAADLFSSHGYDLSKEPLEIAVCAQHNNGGLAGDIWWQSENIRHLFPIGEVNGSHGVNRPGGSALNAGQVGGIRAAEYIAHSQKYQKENSEVVSNEKHCTNRMEELQKWLRLDGEKELQQVCESVQSQMSRVGGIFREAMQLAAASDTAYSQMQEIFKAGIAGDDQQQSRDKLRMRGMLVTQYLMLDAIRFQVSEGVGSRGSSLVLSDEGELIHPALPPDWRWQAEDEGFRDKVLTSWLDESGSARHRWEVCRPIPRQEHWFELDWAKFTSGSIYSEDQDE